MGLLMDIWNGFVDFVFYIWENGDLLAFLILAAIAITAAVYVVTDKEPVHNAFYLALVFVVVAVVYFFLEVEFIGLIQLMVYVGAITMLFAFSIMLTRRHIMIEDEEEEE